MGSVKNASFCKFGFCGFWERGLALEGWFRFEKELGDEETIENGMSEKKGGE